MAQTEPSVLVKLKDGNSMRMTLAELKVYKETGELPDRKPATLTPIKKKATRGIQSIEALRKQLQARAIDARPKAFQKEQVVSSEINDAEDELAPIDTQELAITTPVVDMFVDKAAAEMWDDEDHQSLLDERLHADVESHHEPVSTSTSKMLGMVLKQANVSIDPDLFTRFESIIHARLKDIRGDEETKVYLEKSAAEGGMGLSAEKSDAVLAAIAQAESSRPEPSAPLKPIEKQPMQAYVPLHQPLSPASAPPTPQVRQSSGHKPMVHDIIPSVPAAPPVDTMTHTKRTVGPVDEIANMALLDFRRVGNDPEMAIDVVFGKLAVLKKESYIMYLDAVKGWLHSPLYMVYKTAIVNAINQRMPLSESLQLQQGSGQITEEEVLAVAAINSKLS